MEWLLSISTTLLIFIAAIFILVTVHEFGHFIAAKYFGMRVDRCSIGCPPAIVKWKGKVTEYVIGATPLGGYVQIAGMIDETMDDSFVDEEPQPDEFRSKPVWQRIVVILAGVVFNMILGVIIYTGIAWNYGETVIPVKSIEGIYVREGSLADRIGIQTGDQIIGVNGEEVEYFNQLFSPSRITSRDLTFMVLRDGERLNIQTPPDFLDQINEEGHFLDETLGLPSSISAVMADSPAESAGIEPGDRIVSANGKEISYWVQVVEAIQESDGDIPIEVERGGERISLVVTPDPQTKTIGIQSPNPAEVFDFERRSYGLAQSFVIGYNRTSDTFFGIIKGIGKMFSGDISIRDNLGGPVAIANITKEATDAGGWHGFWNITAFLSITLAIMNMLPIPALDGGYFMFLVYEGITRREPSPKVRMGLQQIGFIFLLGLFILITFNDILRTFGG